jgi:EPS-associated MarR family transcriptional regulator
MNESQFKTLRELSSEGAITQRELSRRLGLSLGSINYIIRALMEKGYIKAQRFKNSNNKLGYIYILTPEGMKQKLKQTQIFMKRKLEEYEQLKQEVEIFKNGNTQR